MKVIGLSGYPGSGKDTASQALLERGWKRLAFGDKLKEGCLGIDPIVHVEPPPWWKSVAGRCGQPKIMRLSDVIRICGGDEAKRRFPEVRRFYQRYGTEGGRDIHGSDCWLRIVQDQIQSLADSESPPPGVVVTDVRFREEYDLVKSWHGDVFYVERLSLSGYVASHRSEEYKFPFDGKLVNDWSIDRLHNDMLFLIERDFETGATDA